MHVLVLLLVAAPNVTPDPTAALPLGPRIEWLVDEDGALTPEEALASTRFSRVEREVPSWGFHHAIVWGRFETTPRAPDERWLLRAGFPRPYHMELWERGADGAVTLRARGGLQEAREGFFADDVVLPLDGAAREHLVRIETAPARVRLELVEASTLAGLRAREMLFAGVYYGIFLGLFLYNLFLGASLRDGTHLLYCAFLVCMVQHVAARDGLHFSEVPDAISRGGAGLTITALIMLVFARRFLRLRERTTRIARVVDRAIVVELAVCGAMALAAFAGAVIGAASAIATAVAVATVVAAAAAVVRDDVPARWFLLAWSVLIASAVWSIVHAFGASDASVLTAHGLKVGSALEMILLSMALASRVRALRTEKERAELALASARADAQEELAGRVIEAQEDERARFARELHDGLGHALLSIRERLAQAVRRGDGLDVDDARRLGNDAQRCIEDARAMARALVPPSLQGLGVVEALRAVCAELADASGVDVRFDDAGAGGLDDAFGDKAIHLVRIAQEAMANAVRHGDATVVDVALAAQPGVVVLTVRDDGKGLPPRPARDRDVTREPPKAGGLGLLDMAHRARLLGGALDVANANDGTGVVVTCRVPHQFTPVLVPAPPPLQKEAS